MATPAAKLAQKAAKLAAKAAEAARAAEAAKRAAEAVAQPGAESPKRPPISTVTEIKALRPEAKPYETRDSKVTGGYFVKWPSGAVTYVLRFRFQKASKKVTLGRFDPNDDGLAEIRVRAREAQNQLTAARKPTADALDPAAAKKVARLAAAQAVQKERAVVKAAKGPQPDAFDKVAEIYLATHGRNLRASTRKEIARLYDKELSAWKNRRLGEIETADVHAVLDAITARGAEITANRLHSYLRHFFVWAKGRKLIATSPLDGVAKPTSEKNRARSRALDDAELAVVWKGATALGFPFGPFFQLAILLGARRNELSGMKWAEIDFDKAVWVIPAQRSKNGQEHKLPLVPQVMALLETLPRFDGPYVFSGGDTPVSGHSRAKKRLDKSIAAANGGQALNEFVVHDLRRSFATGLQRLGVPIEVTEYCLNHKGESFAGIRGVYQRHNYADEMRKALEHWAIHVEALTTEQTKEPSKVIELATARASA
jgi:integrase